MKPKSILETKAIQELDAATEMLSAISSNLNDPNLMKKLSICKLRNDNAGKRIKAAAVARQISMDNKRIEDFLQLSLTSS